jgi:hypothetical protein
VNGGSRFGGNRKKRGRDAETGFRRQAGARRPATAITLYRGMDMTFWLPQTEAALLEAGGNCQGEQQRAM